MFAKECHEHRFVTRIVRDSLLPKRRMRHGGAVLKLEGLCL